MTLIPSNGVLSVALLLGIMWASVGSDNGSARSESLPGRDLDGQMSLEKAIAQRRSVREFAETPLTIDQISQLCWAGQGITEEKTGFRAAPSAGALYPIELYVVTAEAVDHYQPRGHALKRHISGDIRPALQRAALGQKSIGDAPTCIVITAVVKRTARKYGERAERYCFLEAGHVAQNILLQATALRLGGVPVGAFEDQEVARVLNLRGQERVMYLIPIGQPGDQK